MIEAQLTDDNIDDMDESPFCECGNDPIEEEEIAGRCFACGKPLA